MKKFRGKSLLWILPAILMITLSGCGSQSETAEKSQEASVGDEKETADEESTPVITIDEGEDIIIDVGPAEEPEEITEENQENIETESGDNSGSKDVDLIFFMGQSNMSGCGGDASLAPAVIEGAGYEYKAVSDPVELCPIVEPFGYYESVIGGICDMFGDKRGSLVSSFVNTYYESTGNTVIAVSASAGATSTEDWLTPGFVTDITTRMQNAQNFLNNNGYSIKHQYVVWLQGESDALDKVSFEEYQSNMDTIIRPLFIGGFSKVFVITPGRIKNNGNFFNNIISSQLDMCRDSSYYALASTMLCEVSPTYMVDDWHYNQKVLNLLGQQAATAVAYYTNTGKEMCIYDYKNDVTYCSTDSNGDENTQVEPLDINQILSE